MASASFHLPDTAPPGNVFPARNKAPEASRGLSPVPEAATPTSAVELTTLKADTRQVVVEVTESKGEAGLKTPQPSDFPPPPAGRPPASQSTSEPRPTTPQRHGPPQLTIQTGVTRQSPPRQVPSRSDTSSPTLVRNNSNASEEEPNPTPVMRSMFPRLDPSVPLPQQTYTRPQEPAPQSIPPPPSGPPPGHYSPSMYSQTFSPPMAQGSFAPASRMSTMNGSSPLRIADAPPPDLSSGEELLDLWSVANGQNSNEAKETYTLGLYCESLSTHQEAIHFTSSTSAIYSLQSSAGAVLLTRKHPLNPDTEITICRPVLEEPTVTSPLLATVFPCLAELMALDTASNISISHRLNRVDSRALQNEALSRAHASEAAQLLWDSDSSAYYLAHPSLSTATSTSPATLPIQITPNASITLASPTSSPVLTLDLTTQVLTIHVPAILLLSPSLYTLDTLLSTLLTLLLHLHRQTSLLGPHSHASTHTLPLPLPHFDPPPTSASPSPSYPSRARTKPSSQQHKLSRWFSHSRSQRTPTPGSPGAHSTALTPYHGPAPHSPALSTMTTPHLTSSSPHASPYAYPYDKDLESSLPTLSTPIPSIPAHGVAPELRRETTGVDLSRFQAFDLSDPELGRGTKVALRVLYWGFGVLVWCLGVGVGVLAAGVVAVGGCAGGGKGKGRREGRRETIGNSKRGGGGGRAG